MGSMHLHCRWKKSRKPDLPARKCQRCQWIKEWNSRKIFLPLPKPDPENGGHKQPYFSGNRCQLGANKTR